MKTVVARAPTARSQHRGIFHCYYIFREPFSVSHLALTMAHLWSLARGPVVAAVFVPSPKHAASLRDKQVKI